VQRDAKDVLAEVLGKLRGKLDAPAESTMAKENRRGNTVGPNRDRLAVGVDLGDRWSQYCILGLEGETLAEGQLWTTQEDVREFFQALTVVRVLQPPPTSPCQYGYVIFGSVTQFPSSATYYAPLTPGTYHVTFQATQNTTFDYLSKTATATITVTP
jgi:hypothetical protein